jgi:hypothetical protein
MGKLKNKHFGNVDWRDDFADDYLDDDYHYEKWKRKQKRKKQEGHFDDSDMID